MSRNFVSLAGIAIATGAVIAAARGDSTPPSSPALADAPSAPAADTAIRTRNAETFDAMWTTVRDSHWDPERVGASWDAVRAELLPKAGASTNRDELRAVLMDALARLGQSHFTIIPGELSSAAPGAVELREGRSGATLRFAPRGDEPDAWDAIVVSVEGGSPAATAGIAPGMRVLRIGDRELGTMLPPGDGLERYQRANVAAALASGEPGTTAAWRIEPLDGEPRDVDVTYEADTRPQAKFASLPPMPTELTSRRLDEKDLTRWGAAGREIGVISFNIWLIPVARPFDQAIDSLRGADGIVIDLRGNPGGIGAMAMGIAGHFTNEPVSLGEMRTRDTKLSFVTNPRRSSAAGTAVEPFSGPVAILVDDASASTTEIFAGGMQHIGRAKVFGHRTAGAALPAMMTPLPNGDVFLHAFADYRLPDGTALEATGVRPDNAQPYDRAAYAREGDPALAEAVRWIAASQRTPKPGPKDPQTTAP
jgi:carboxyl-terminal processing protease